MKKIVTTLALATIFTSSLLAVPAMRKPITYTQPDGTVITIQKIGDERRHVTMTADGFPIVMDAKGYYRFAEITDAGTVAATDIRAAALSQLTADERAKVSAINAESVKAKIMTPQRKSKYDNRPARIASRAGSYNGIGLMDDSFLGFTEVKGLVILAQYTDVKFNSMTSNGYFQRMLNDKDFSEYSGTGSARDYFIDNSNGKFVPQFDVYGPVTLPNKMSYYGGNDDVSGDDKNPAQMIYDACKALDGTINFKDYDCDGDGYVDNVFVFYAGYGEASYGDDDTVWPHQWDLTSAGLSLKLDGVTIEKYACANELEKDYDDNPLPDGIGTFVHEFSHVIGLPDLYATDGSDGDWTPASWSVLDQGPYNNDGRTPPAYGAYERNALGWCEPVVITGPASIELEAINTSNQAYLIPTSKQNEFFLLENRQQTGWDKYIPGHGMLIWHIDYNESKWQDNSVNNTSTHSCVDIEEACGYYVKMSDYIVGGYYLDYEAWEKALAAYAFPGTSNVTQFTDDTKPSMKSWAGQKLNLPITDIAESDGIILFNVAGGGSDASVPEIAPVQSVGKDFFVASWHTAEGAVAYKLTVQSDVEFGAENSAVADFGSGSTLSLPRDWSFVSTKGEMYITDGNYGESSPSLKLTKTGAGFQTSTFDSDIKSIEFWLKGQGTNNGSYISIQANTSSNKWTQISKVVPEQNKAKIVKIDDIPSGVRQIRVLYTKNVGNVAIDDFTITAGGAGTVTLEDYNDLNVGNVTSYRVDKLLDGVNEYAYKVRAVDANGHMSAYSEICKVSLGSAGIEDVAFDDNSALTVSGRTLLYIGRPMQALEVVDVTGRRIATFAADSEGRACLTLPSSGIYVVAAGSLKQKIMVK